MKHLYQAALMIEALGLAESGTDLFVGTMPNDVHKGVMLLDPLFGAELDPGMGNFVVHQFQVIVRHPHPEEAWQLAKAISDGITVDDLTADGIYILKMYPLALPATYPKMDSDELETSVRMRVAFSLT